MATKYVKLTKEEAETALTEYVEKHGLLVVGKDECVQGKIGYEGDPQVIRP